MSDYYFNNDDINDYEDELADILKEHVYKEIRLSLPNKYRLVDFDMEFMPIQNRRSSLRRKLQSTRNFLLSGKLLFIKDLLPEVDDVDATVLQSFTGRSLTSCLESLKNAENIELRYIYDLEATMFETPSEINAVSREAAAPNNPWYLWYKDDTFLIIVISAAGVCLLLGLVALTIAVRRNRESEFRVRQSRTRRRGRS